MEELEDGAAATDTELEERGGAVPVAEYGPPLGVYPDDELVQSVEVTHWSRSSLDLSPRIPNEEDPVYPKVLFLSCTDDKAIESVDETRRKTGEYRRGPWLLYRSKYILSKCPCIATGSTSLP